MSLWLCIALPRLALEALGSRRDDTQAVVYDKLGSRRWVVAAAHPRIVAGEALGSVQARFPEVHPRARDLAAESAALEAVACAAYRLSDRIVLVCEPSRAAFDLPFHAVGIEVEPSLKLFGGIDALMQQAQQLLAGLPYTCRVGLAATLDAAAVAARHGLAPIVQRSDLRERLSPLPLDALRWPLPALEILAGSGHRTLGDVLRHDSASLAARLGPEFPAALDRLLGRLPDPRPWFTPPPRYRRRLDLDVEIDDWQALLFPLKRLFDEFEAYLRARQVAVSQLSLTLARRRTEGERFSLRTTAPTQSAEVFFRLLRERWNGKPPQAPASELRLHADQFLPLHSPQTQLFDDSSAEGEAWNTLADRLRARLGEAALWRPGLADDHRPEHAWSRDAQHAQSDAAAAPAARPLWLLREPQPLAPHDEAPGVAERITGGWWDDQPLSRDYRFVVAADHRQLWIYRDNLQERWYVHGMER